MNGYWGPFKQSPNLLILLTDQQRTTQDFGTTMQPEREGWQGGPVTVPPADVNTLGGGGGGNDQRVATGLSYVTGGTVEGAQQWLAAQAGTEPNNPFCLVVSLLNPHDI